MELNDLLRKQGIDLAQTIVMRHRPVEAGLRKVLPWMVHELPECFNAYQQAHNILQEAAIHKIAGNGWIASFFGLTAGEAVFCGLYRVHGCRKLDMKSYWAIPANQVLREHGMLGWADQMRKHILWFDLKLESGFYAEWIGRLSVKWPPPERSWWRRAEKNIMPISAILEESRFAPPMPNWREMTFSWHELKVIPKRWQGALKEWRGIYLIRDMRDGLAYVGSAYGKENLLGRWKDYAKSGDGGDKLLKPRKPDQFRFSILERLNPDLNAKEVVAAENSWKKRLGTLHPYGLNLT